MTKLFGKAPGLKTLFRALLIWCLIAFLLLVSASLVLSRLPVGSSVLGYVSSSVNFLAALAAGVSLNRGESNSIYPFLLLALLLLILLLTIGFLAGDRSLNPSGILSVVTFTVSGVLAGTLFHPRSSRRKSFSSRTLSRR